jgi:predicted anti-sigma-YlaC factor YlaD
MNCETAIELLPWLLNGTLEAAEREAVRLHLKDCEPCRWALSQTGEAWAVFDQHLPSAALVALAYGEAVPDLAADWVEQHLATCARCAADLELARTSRRLEEEENLLPFVAPVRQRTAVPAVAGRSDRRWQVSALAAGLVGVVALGGWLSTARLAHTRDEALRKAQSTIAAGVGVVQQSGARVLSPQARGTLQPEETLRGAEPAAPAVQSFPAGVAIDLTLPAKPHLRDELRRATFTVEVRDAGDRPVLPRAEIYYLPAREDGAELPNGFYRLVLPGLPAGDYTLHVDAKIDGQEKPFDKYSLRVAAR